MGPKRPPRLRSFEYVGPHAYFLTICAAARESPFRLPACVEQARGHLLQTSVDYRFAVIAYCFMPDHLHALVEGLADDSDFRRWVAMFKQRSAFEWRRAGGAALWQEGYHEHVLRDGERRYPEIVAYLWNNPVRAGLCQTPSEHPYLGSDRYSLEALADLMQTATLPWNSRP